MAAHNIAKACWACKTEKPLTEFPKNRSKPDGYGTECKVCKRTQDADYYARHRAKHLAQFKKHRENNPEYFQKYGREYYRKNKDRMRAASSARYKAKSKDILAADKAWRQANPEAFKAKTKRLYWKNREVMQGRARRYYSRKREADPESIRRQSREWAKKNPEKRKAISHNDRAKRKQAVGVFSHEQLIAKYDFHGWRCYLCGVSVTLRTSHSDHRKSISKGGTNWIANIAPACSKCNLTKNHKTEAQHRRAAGICRYRYVPSLP